MLSSSRSSNCLVCLKDYNSGRRKPRCLPCGHVFCERCLRGVVATGASLCPQCRSSWGGSHLERLVVVYCLIPSFEGEVHEIPGCQVTEVFLKDLRGVLTAVKVSGGQERVECLRGLIEGALGIPSAMQMLLFGGRQLEDGNTLSSYGIKQQSTVHIVCRLRGGNV